MTTKADHAVDRAADHLQEIANKAAAEGGIAGKFAQELADDAAFLRMIKPSLIAARVKGRAPRSGPPSHGTVDPTTKKSKRSGGPSPLLVIGVAFAAGIVLARLIDWRNDADPPR